METSAAKIEEIGIATPKEMANAIRALAMDAVQKANSGHPGMPMGMADVATVLFSKFMKFDPSMPKWQDRDRFVLSGGHGSMLLYSLLYLTGYKDMPIEKIKNFRQLHGAPGHPEVSKDSGIETTTGPLGQGIANAVGMAIAEKIMAARFGRDIVDHYTYVMCGDGDLMEGISHEACSLAGHLGLGKLIMLYDDNGICIDGSTDKSFTEDVQKRFEAYGWEVFKVDGHNHEEVAKAISQAQLNDAKPAIVCCKTKIGFGAPTKEGTESCHGSPLGEEELSGAKKNLGIEYPAFEIPAHILNTWREIGKLGLKDRKNWQADVDKLPSEKRYVLDRALSGDLTKEVEEIITTFKADMKSKAPKIATRKASQMVLDVLAADLPELLGGSADLTGSNLTKAKSMKSITPEDMSGDYIHYGVREHAMAAIMNGIALHKGFIPYGGTFLTFVDYCRNSVRLSALMQRRVIYVMTHDSIGLGEDGPTHQPVEHLASLRCMPNVYTMRPCDVVETAECWQVALDSRRTPSVLALSRQNLPLLRTEQDTKTNLTRKGAYVLREAEGAHVATIWATGSEVELAIKARDMLQEEGIGTRVISAPCLELFDEQDDEYKNSLTKAGKVQLAVEAAIRFGWDKYIGSDGLFVGMEGFGDSAPAEVLYEHFGITPAAVVAKIKNKLKN